MDTWMGYQFFLCDIYLDISGCIRNTLFSLELQNGLSKLECYVTLVWKALQEMNTIAYWGNL